jgi:hypothetical protein
VNVPQANLEDLLARYYEATSARAAAEHLLGLIRDQKQAELAALLRDHRERTVEDPVELELRAAVDQLLTCYSAFEVACIAGFIPSIPDGFRSQAGTILGHREVRRFYEKLYPTRLPTLFLRRIQRNGSGPLVEGPAVAGVMIAFLELDRQFTEKLAEKTLLLLLDSFTLDEERFDDFVNLLGTPAAFIERLLDEDNHEDVLALAAKEFGLFMQFCFDLRDLLIRTEIPLLQSAVWTYYSYWFDILGRELNTRLGQALERFLQWKADGEEAAEASEEIQDYVRRARGVLEELTSGAYGDAIKSLL